MISDKDLKEFDDLESLFDEIESDMGFTKKSEEDKE